MKAIQLTNIKVPHHNDVLLGRGIYVNHAGNKRYKAYISYHEDEYAETQKRDKGIFAERIVNAIRNLEPPGRFLKRDTNTQLWADIGDKKANLKIRQEFRLILKKKSVDVIHASMEHSTGPNANSCDKSLVERPLAETKSTSSSSTAYISGSQPCTAIHNDASSAALVRKKRKSYQIPTPRFLQHDFCSNGDNTTVVTSRNSELHTFTTRNTRHDQENRSDVTNFKSIASSSNYLPYICGEPFTAAHHNAFSVSGVGNNQLVSQILTPGLFPFCTNTVPMSDPSNYKLQKSTTRASNVNKGTIPGVNIFEAASPIHRESPRSSSANCRAKVPTSPTHVAEIDVFEKGHFEKSHIFNSEYDDNESFIHKKNGTHICKGNVQITHKGASLRNDQNSRFSDVTIGSSNGANHSSNSESSHNDDDGNCRSTSFIDSFPSELDKNEDDFIKFMFGEETISLSKITKEMNYKHQVPPMDLDDLSQYSGRLSICDKMTFVDSRLFGNDDVEVTDWEIETHELSMDDDFSIES